MKVSNFFWSTFLGMMPSLFLIISIGSGLEEIIDQNLEAPSIIDLISSPSIYIPITAFFVLLGITIFFRRMFYKNYGVPPVLTRELVITNGYTI